MDKYTQGSVVRFRGTFRKLNRLYDPTEVQFVMRNAGTWSDPITYTDATEPAVGVIARVGIGAYETLVATADLSGTVLGKFYSTGDGEGAQWREVLITTPPSS